MRSELTNNMRLLAVLLALVWLLAITPFLHAAEPKAVPMVVAEQSKAECAVVGYMNAYRYRDFSAVGHFDSVISSFIDDLFGKIPPGNNQGREAERLGLESMRRAEREKLAGTGTDPFASRPASGWRPLHKALYPEMRFKIIKIRDTGYRAPGGDRDSDRELVVELNYADSAHAPQHLGRAVKTGLVKILVRPWKVYRDYRVLGYRPLSRGLKYF